MYYMNNNDKITQQAKSLYTLWRSKSTQPFSYHTADELWTDPEQPDVKAWEGFTASLPTYLIQSGLTVATSQPSLKNILISLLSILLALSVSFGLMNGSINSNLFEKRDISSDDFIKQSSTICSNLRDTPPYEN